LGQLGCEFSFTLPRFSLKLSPKLDVPFRAPVAYLGGT
jgi:hypothetical protein